MRKEGQNTRIALTGGSIGNVASRAGAMWKRNIEEVKALMALDVVDLPAFVANGNLDAMGAYNVSKEAVIAPTLA